MKRNLSPEAMDDPQITEFASWRSYRKFEERVKRYRRHIWDQEIEAFLKTVMQTRQGRDAEILKAMILWRDQLGVEYVPLGSVVKRVCSRSSLPGVGRRPSMMPPFWRNGSPPRATA